MENILYYEFLCVGDRVFMISYWVAAHE